MRIHHTTLIVDDIQAAGEFYVEQLGLTVIPREGLDYPYLFLRVNDEQELHLAEFTDARSFRGHVCLRLRDWSAAFWRFRDRLDVTPWGKVRELPGGVMQCYVRDPAGNLVELTSEPEDRSGIDPAIFRDPAYGGQPYRSGRGAGRTYSPGGRR